MEEEKKKFFRSASLSCCVWANGALASSLCAQGNVSFTCTPQASLTGRTRYPPSFFPNNGRKTNTELCFQLQGGRLRHDGQQTKPESAVFLAANQSPVFCRVAHMKQSGKRERRYFPVCRGCRGKRTRGTRDCSKSTDECLNTTFWPNRPSGPWCIYEHMNTHGKKRTRG